MNDTSYHFNVGNSNNGQIGLCARVKGQTRQEATERLRKVLLEALTDGSYVQLRTDDPSVEYINIYISPGNFSPENIDEEEPTTEEQPHDDLDRFGQK